MKNLLLIVLCLLFSSPTIADVIYFKDGKSFETTQSWEEGNMIKCERFGGVISYPKSSIERIEKGLTTREKMELEKEIEKKKAIEKAKEIEKKKAIDETNKMIEKAIDETNKMIELHKIESDTTKSETKIEEVNKPILIGEWRDYLGSFWDQRIKIIKENNKFYVINTFTDGSNSKALLNEISPLKNYKLCFKDIERGRGDIYAIDYNGDLGLFDNQGFIRKAVKFP